MGWREGRMDGRIEGGRESRRRSLCSFLPAAFAELHGEVDDDSVCPLQLAAVSVAKIRERRSEHACTGQVSKVEVSGRSGRRVDRNSMEDHRHLPPSHQPGETSEATGRPERLLIAVWRAVYAKVGRWNGAHSSRDHQGTTPREGSFPMRIIPRLVRKQSVMSEWTSEQ